MEKLWSLSWLPLEMPAACPPEWLLYTLRMTYSRNAAHPRRPSSLLCCPPSSRPMPTRYAYAYAVGRAGWRHCKAEFRHVPGTVSWCFAGPCLHILLTFTPLLSVFIELPGFSACVEQSSTSQATATLFDAGVGSGRSVFIMASKPHH